MINSNEGNYVCFNERLYHQFFSDVLDTVHRYLKSTYVITRICHALAAAVCAAPFGLASSAI